MRIVTVILLCLSAWVHGGCDHLGQSPTLAPPESSGPSSPAAKAPSSLQGVARLASQHPLPQVPSHLTDLRGLSPDGRWLLAWSYGPGSSQDNLHVVDLSGQVRTANLAYATGGTFVLDGNSLAYWRFQTADGSELHLRDLRTGTDQRIYPAPGSQELRHLYRGANGRWLPKTGEFAFDGPRNGVSGEYAVRLRDGAVRRIGPEREGLASPGGRYRAWTREANLQQPPATVSSVWIAGPTGHYRLAHGRLFDWIGEKQGVIVTRSGGVGEKSTTAYFRVGLRGETKAFLFETAGADSVRISPSRSWLLVLEKGRLRLVAARDGRTQEVPLPEVQGFGWGRSDTELLVHSRGSWSRVEISPGTGGIRATAPVPDRLALELTDPTPLSWRPLAPTSNPWQVYLPGAELVTAAQVGEECWVGTTQGLHVLNRQGQPKPLLPWQAALRGYRIDTILPEGERVWLGARRNAAHNPGQDFESLAVRADLRTGRADHRYLSPKGWGDEQHIRRLVPGERHLALNGKYGWVEQWEDEQIRYVANPAEPGGKLHTLCAMQDRKGALWTGGYFGAARWTYGTAPAEVWTAKQGLPSAPVLALAEADDRIWLGTAAGLAVLDPRSGKIQAPPQGDVVGEEPVNALYRGDGALYAITPKHVAVREDASGQWRRWPLPAGFPARIAWDGRRLLGTFGKSPEVRRLASTGQWKPFARLPNGPLATRSVDRLLWLDGALWCGQGQDLVRLDPRTEASKILRLGHPGESIQDLRAAEGTILASTWRGGVVQVHPKRGVIRRWLESIGTDTLCGKPIRPVVYSAVIDSRYLYGIADEGLFRVDRHSGARRRISLLDLSEHGGYAAARLLDHQPHQLSIIASRGTASDRLVQVSLPSLRAREVKTDVSYDTLDPVASTADGGFWIAGDRLRRLSPEGKVAQELPLPPEIRGGFGSELHATPGYLWYVSPGPDSGPPYQHRVVRASLPGGRWEELPPCPLTGVRQVLVAGGSLWAGTWNGLARLRLQP